MSSSHMPAGAPMKCHVAAVAISVAAVSFVVRTSDLRHLRPRHRGRPAPFVLGHALLSLHLRAAASAVPPGGPLRFPFALADCLSPAGRRVVDFGLCRVPTTTLCAATTGRMTVLTVVADVAGMAGVAVANTTALVAGSLLLILRKVTIENVEELAGEPAPIELSEDAGAVVFAVGAAIYPGWPMAGTIVGNPFASRTGLVICSVVALGALVSMMRSVVMTGRSHSSALFRGPCFVTIILTTTQVFQASGISVAGGDLHLIDQLELALAISE